MKRGVTSNMTRKHYVLIADAIKDNIHYVSNKDDVKDVDLHGLISSLCYVFKCDNERFSSTRFNDYINGNL